MAKLEELIKQTKFRSEKQKALISIMLVSNLLNNHHENFFKKFGLTLQQYNVLRILRGQFPNPCTVNLIRERMLDRMSDASRIVERLRKAGFVERVQSAKDRRAVDVVITRKGLNSLAQIDKYEEEMQKPVELLAEKDAKQLSELLQKMLDKMTE
ncbi:MAG: MarR family winged helix-turn-helix transcriptional regulator [Chitinophagales bacterium]